MKRWSARASGSARHELGTRCPNTSGKCRAGPRCRRDIHRGPVQSSSSFIVRSKSRSTISFPKDVCPRAKCRLLGERPVRTPPTCMEDAPLHRFLRRECSTRVLLHRWSCHLASGRQAECHIHICTKCSIATERRRCSSAQKTNWPRCQVHVDISPCTATPLFPPFGMVEQSRANAHILCRLTLTALPKSVHGSWVGANIAHSFCRRACTVLGSAPTCGAQDLYPALGWHGMVTKVCIPPWAGGNHHGFHSRCNTNCTFPPWPSGVVSAVAPLLALSVDVQPSGHLRLPGGPDTRGNLIVAESSLSHV